MPSIEAFLREMVERGASDLHMTTASPPMIRLHGELTPIAHPPLTASDTKNLCYSLLTEGQKKRFEEESELDFSFGIRGVARFRGNMYNQKGCVGGAFRTIPHQTPQLNQLGLPPAVIDMTKLPRVTQIQVHPKIGLTFAHGLRSILRQDPDIIMVGEIRDAETLASCSRTWRCWCGGKTATMRLMLSGASSVCSVEKTR